VGGVKVEHEDGLKLPRRSDTSWKEGSERPRTEQCSVAQVSIVEQQYSSWNELANKTLYPLPSCYFVGNRSFRDVAEKFGV
jgi:hypothetical protein